MGSQRRRRLPTTVPPTLSPARMLSTSARNCSWLESTQSTSRSEAKVVSTPRLPDPALSRPSGLLPETGSGLAGLRMSLLFLPTQPEGAAVAEVEDCEQIQATRTRQRQQ